MKLSELRLSSPALVAALVAVAGIAALDSRAPDSDEIWPVAAVAAIPAPNGDVPFIGEITVTASRD
jgi:hypothetical protein